MAIIDDTAPPKTGPSLTIQIGLFLALTAVAVGIGWFSGLLLNSRQPSASSTAQDEILKATTTSLPEAHEALGVVYLDPLTTNLSGPARTWVRLELALVFEGEPNMEIARAVQEETLAYLRTVKVHQIDGASGFQHLRSDLEERASLRSEGKVKSILIKTLLFE